MFPNALPNFPTSPTSTALMRFTAKVVLADYVKRDGTQCVEIRGIIDRRQACVSLGFCVKANDFDQDRGVAKRDAPNADLINYQIAEAIARANKIYLDYKYSGRYLSPDLFRKEFVDPASNANFNDFMDREIELRKPKLEKSTYGIHKDTLAKLRKFQSRILFAELTVELMQRFENTLIDKYKLNQNTIHKVFRTIKVYLHEAQRKGIHFKDPFEQYKVKQVQPKKAALSMDEVKAIYEYYTNTSTTANHRKVMRYFLFSCFTGVRISDIIRLQWDHLHGDTLIFVPFKTRKRNKTISIPLTETQRSLLPEFNGQKFLFDTFVEQVSNRILKEIARKCLIKKTLTYHISRHTFATLFLDRDGSLETLKEILGHSMITTTMQYVTVKEQRKHDEMAKAFNVELFRHPLPIESD